MEHTLCPDRNAAIFGELQLLFVDWAKGYEWN